jgi:serine/threonine protein kinase
MDQPQESLFGRMALESGLIDALRLQKCWDAVLPAKRTPDTIDRRLARRAVQAGYLTLWQAHEILQGRGANIRINKYTLLSMIGHGGMGCVYLAMDTRLNRQVALKVLAPNRLTQSGAAARLQREARLGAQLQHENLVRIYDAGEENGQQYLVMEYIEGDSVGQLLTEHGPMPASTAARLALQVALGLEHARRKDMIHRDVNPWNILVTHDGTAKLTDLGLAIDLGDDNNILTRDGALLGNYDYISPEQARHSRNVDTRSDIYSLGCTLYHMVAGSLPFPYPSPAEKIYALFTVDPPPLCTLVPGVPEGLNEVVSKMMRKSPEERYQNPLAVAGALEPFIARVAVTGRGSAAATAWAKADSRDPAQAPAPIRPAGPAAVFGSGGALPSSSLQGISPQPSSSEFDPLIARPSSSLSSSDAPFATPVEMGPETAATTGSAASRIWNSVIGLASSLWKSGAVWKSASKR